MKNIVLIVISLAYTVHCLAAPELKGSPQELKGFLYPNDNIVSISAFAEEKAYSDQAIVSVVITTESKQLSGAIGKNSEVRAKITQTLVDSGIDKSAIKSSKFSSSPQYGWFGSKPASYEVINRMAIVISDETHLKTIAELADQSSDIELSDTEFEHSKKDEFNQKVKAKALDKILKQKEFYETSLGVTLTTVGIRDSNIQHMGTRGARLRERKIDSYATAEVSAASASSVERIRNQAESSFDEVIYQANLSIEFKISH